jgi:hypothetical protein
MVLLIVMADNHSLVFEERGDGFIDSDGWQSLFGLWGQRSVLLIVMADNHSLVFEVRGDGFIDSDGWQSLFGLWGLRSWFYW